MGDTTDDLLALAGRITEHMPKREMDMLLATGEQVSIALLATAFMERGRKRFPLPDFRRASVRMQALQKQAFWK